MQKTTTPATGVPLGFRNRFGHQILGSLSGFDRLRLRGSLRHLFQPTVMEAYLNASRVLIKDFGTFAHKLSARVREASYRLAENLGRPVEYLRSNQRSKEQIAKEIAQRDKVQSGLIAILSALEPCQSYSVLLNAPPKRSIWCLRRVSVFSSTTISTTRFLGSCMRGCKAGFLLRSISVSTDGNG